jgi:hypothetical protein
MKQKLDEVRTLAIKLFEAGEREKRKHAKCIWGQSKEWRDLPSESVAVWDAVAICAYDQLAASSRRHNAGTQRPGSPDVSLATESRKPGSLK